MSNPVKENLIKNLIMENIKVLNLYSGLGGNRKLWKGADVTAIEYDKETAEVYKKYFPNDTVLITDAHEYLLNNYMNFDFIWSSPPCPTHSDIRRCAVHGKRYDALYPEMGLYQEIILLKNFAPKKTKFIIENVRPYYEPLIYPDFKLHRHYYWSNFKVSNFEVNDNRKHNDITGNEIIYGFEIKDTNILDKRKALRNMVNPELGLHIFNCAKNIFNKKESKQQEFIFNK
jgi:DNA (cytosine-5)-methyltransferase 1